VHTVDLVDARIEQLERAIRETAKQEPFRELVARLRCLRGIDTLTALAIVAEIGDFHRFKTAAEFMAFIGLVPIGGRRSATSSPVANAAKTPP
jgi:transposase